ncbi:hypothetical protein LCM00_13520 [Bacillus infantis]|uniref:hypothetical protein n=1 Tax=Bacillus infantis TaxID=324767 RepID=UPI001CD80326|nr:hypothetical protein [Bacillus infantis]MCA1040527.1 hypothetical protein [Bacillus infantis]
MKNFFYRTIISIILSAIVLTVILLPNTLQGIEDKVPAIFVVFLYSLLFILLYGGISSIVAEIISIRIIRGNRVLIKTFIYLLALIVFSLLSPSVIFTIYAFIIAIIYFVLDEYLRKKQTQV